MAVAWVTRVNLKPPMMAVALGKNHYTNIGIKEHKEFSISLPNEEMLKLVDYMGIVSGAKIDKSKLVKFFYGELTNAPMVQDCPLTMECRLVQHIELNSNDLFIGEVVAAYSEDQYLTKGMPDAIKMRPFTLSMPDNTYYGLGEKIGDAWKDGNQLR